MLEIWFGIGGSNPLSPRLFQVQYSLKPLRFQAITVSGFTTLTTECEPFHRRDNQTQILDPPTSTEDGDLVLNAARQEVDDEGLEFQRVKTALVLRQLRSGESKRQRMAIMETGKL